MLEQERRRRFAGFVRARAAWLTGGTFFLMGDFFFDFFVRV
jgi:hypothetical protein